MVVSELIEALKRANPNSDVALDVYGHFYHSKNDWGSHGPIEILAWGPTVLIRSSLKDRSHEWLVLGKDKDRV